MLVPPCVYRDLADEAYRVDGVTLKETRIDLWLCTWPTTMGPRPRWVERAIGNGLAINPAHDCPGCPVRNAGGTVDLPPNPAK